jgi:hypothetical protein
LACSLINAATLFSPICRRSGPAATVSAFNNVRSLAKASTARMSHLRAASSVTLRAA